MKRYTNKELKEFKTCQWCGAGPGDDRKAKWFCGNSDLTTTRSTPCWFEFVEAHKAANDEIKQLKRQLREFV